MVGEAGRMWGDLARCEEIWRDAGRDVVRIHLNGSYGNRDGLLPLLRWARTERRNERLLDCRCGGRRRPWGWQREEMP